MITVQGRGRVNLGKLATHDRYLARSLEDGTILLEPAAIVPVTVLRQLETAVETNGVAHE